MAGETIETKQIAANFGIYAFNNFRRPSAQQYYRILLPLKTLFRLGLANAYGDDGSMNRDYAMQMMIASDIALAWNLTGDAGMAAAEQFRSYKPIYKNGVLLVPPAYVFDMDDAIEMVHPMNDSFATWGIRNWEGEFLKAGDELTWPAPDGTTRVIWKDKVTQNGDILFDIERNFETVRQHYEIAKTARGVTVTTEYLAKLYRDNGAKNVYVFPNSIEEEDYFFPNLAPHEGTRILWQGSTSHWEDWMPVSEVLPEVLKENPSAKLVVWGSLFSWMKKRIAPEQLEFHGWDDYAVYKMKRPCLDADINLCPLIDSPFNRGKSAIKWYEGCVGPRPEATLAANVGPYQEIEHGKTGLLYNNPQEFKEGLTALIRNVELRKTLAARGQQWVRANRAAKRTVVGLHEFYQSLKSEQRVEALLEK